MTSMHPVSPVSRILVQHPSLLDGILQVPWLFLVPTLTDDPQHTIFWITAASKCHCCSPVARNVFQTKRLSIAPLVRSELICITNRRISLIVAVSTVAAVCDVHAQHLIMSAHRIRSTSRGPLFENLHAATDGGKFELKQYKTSLQHLSSPFFLSIARLRSFFIPGSNWISILTL